MADNTTILSIADKISTIEQLKKFISRKLLVWLVTTVFLALGNITAEQWFGVTMAYIGAEGGADILTRFRKKKDTPSDSEGKSKND